MPISPNSTLIIPRLSPMVIVDAVTRMVPRKKKKLTRHPVENGANIAEHVSDDECYLTLDVTFTDDATPLGVSVPGTTADDKRQAVVRIWDNPDIVNIETPRESFHSYMLLDIDEEVTVQNSKAFKATLTFDKVRLAEVGLATIPLSIIKKRVGDKKTGAQKQVPAEDKGVQSAEEVDDAEPYVEMWSSILGV